MRHFVNSGSDTEASLLNNKQKQVLYLTIAVSQNRNPPLQAPLRINCQLFVGMESLSIRSLREDQFVGISDWIERQCVVVFQLDLGQHRSA